MPVNFLAMAKQDNQATPPGWVGGFEGSESAFAYPDPDLSSLPFECNLTHINLLQRQMDVQWPQFSWETVPGQKDSRCYQMFSPYISRIGYTDKGKVYSIICPQQGTWIKGIGTLNVEVTVTGVRGWVDEDTREMAADVKVVPRLWFSPDATQSTLGRMIWSAFEALSVEWPFPDEKRHAMQLNTSLKGHPDIPQFPLRRGTACDFPIPAFANHEGEAWAVSNLEVEIGSIRKSTSSFVDDFNALVLKAFNVASGNLLTQGNVLAWNVWFRPPQLVDKTEWADHAEKWRHSIDVDHRAPTGSGTTPQYFNGDPFTVKDALINEAINDIIKFLTGHAFAAHHPMVH